VTVETLRLAGFSETSSPSYHHDIEEALSDGWRFAGTHVAFDGRAVRTLLVAPDGATRLISAKVRSGVAPSIVDLTPAAGWDEREAHDLHGICFAGHEPLRPLVNRAALSEWTVPLRGDDAYQVAVGPIHAGIIESGHFRFHLVGDRILHLDAQLFYKHRGLERAAEGTDLETAGKYLGRACAACAVSNAVAYAHAWEEALGLASSKELARTRTVLLELERVWSHLNDIAAMCAGVGLAAGNTHFAALTERARRLNATLTGHRFLFGTVRVGSSELVVAGDTVDHALAELAALRQAAASGWRELTFNASFQDRLPGTGTLTADEARALGTVGPAARASGLAIDARCGSPRLAYEDFQPVTVADATGDVRARLEQRAVELWQSLAILERLLSEGPLERADATPRAESRPVGVGLVESPRGTTSCVVEREGRDVRRVRLRTGSFANWPSVATAASGDRLFDFPLINKSFELCYACVDR
jgi:Ni,Fe-hydrogenase III large subunit